LRALKTNPSFLIFSVTLCLRSVLQTFLRHKSIKSSHDKPHF
jgi:hypothetical protein